MVLNKFLKNSLGFSLPELMVSSSIGVIVALGIGSIFIFSATQFQLMLEKSQAEENALLLSFYTRVFLSQAVDLRPRRVDPTHGYLKYDFDIRSHNETGGSTPGNIMPGNNNNMGFLASFNRQWGTTGSEIIPTLIFFRNSDRTPNVIALDDISQRSARVGIEIDNRLPLLPPYPSIEFDRVHKFEVLKIPVVAGAALSENRNELDANINTWCLAIEVEPRPAFLVGATMGGQPIPPNCLPPPGSTITFGGNTVTLDANSGVFENNPPFVHSIPITDYKIKSVTVRIVTRHFKSIDKTSWNYASAPNIAGTAWDFNTVFPAYRDVDMTVVIPIKNNVLRTPASGGSLTGGAARDERVHGGLFYFRPVFPRFN